jgi:uncharacterized protein YgbK (DUF1537 family)
MILGCIADDFTGASDLGNTLAKGGMAVTQFVGVPAGRAPEACEAGIVSLKSRTIPAGEAVAQSLAALDWLKAQGCRQILFKYCSTFDSTPEGNIGPVAEALLARLGGIAVVCPVFPATGRTLFNGHLFVGDRLLAESGMQNHPLTPMTDPDIRRWLRRQMTGEVGHVGLAIVREGAVAIRTALGRLAGSGIGLAVVDATSDDDLLAIGSAVDGHALVTGGSGIALGLPANFRAAGLIGAGGSAFSGQRGPAVALSGSCSAQSLRQVEAHAADHPALAIEPGAVLAGAMTPAMATGFAMKHEGGLPIIHSTATPEVVSAAQQRFGKDAVAAGIERFFAELAVGLVNAGFTRLAVGGGETSGAIVTALGIGAFAIGPEIDPGVPALAIEGRPLAMALKSGNFGGLDFYEKACAMLEGTQP